MALFFLGVWALFGRYLGVWALLGCCFEVWALFGRFGGAFGMLWALLGVSAQILFS